MKLLLIPIILLTLSNNALSQGSVGNILTNNTGVKSGNVVIIPRIESKENTNKTYNRFLPIYGSGSIRPDESEHVILEDKKNKKEKDIVESNISENKVENQNQLTDINILNNNILNNNTPHNNNNLSTEINNQIIVVTPKNELNFYNTTRQKYIEKQAKENLINLK